MKHGPAAWTPALGSMFFVAFFAVFLSDGTSICDSPGAQKLPCLSDLDPGSLGWLARCTVRKLPIVVISCPCWLPWPQKVGPQKVGVLGDRRVYMGNIEHDPVA